jgi:hypothetical protein
MSANIRPNTILDLDNASTSYVNSEIDNYDWVKIYDSTYGSGVFFPPEPPSLNFRSSDVSNFYDWRNAYLCVQFQVKKRIGQDDAFTTCRSDPIRELIRKATFKINDTVIADCDYVGKYAIMDRACYSEQFYNTSAKEWLCYDEDADTADFPPCDHTSTNKHRRPAGNAKWIAKTQAHLNVGAPPHITDPSNLGYNAYDTIDKVPDVGNLEWNANPPNWDNDLHTGIGKLFRLTNAYTVVNPPTAGVEDLGSNASGSIVSARIPMMCIFRFFAYLKCVLKNCIFDFRFELFGSSQEDRKGKLWQLTLPAQVDTNIADGDGFLLRNAWIEVPRVVPSPSRIVSLNNSLLNSPKIAISYPNYQVYRNPIAAGVTETEFLIQNVTERIIRVTCFLQRQTRDTSQYFEPWNCICPEIKEFNLKINGISVPYSNMKNSWNSERFPYLATLSENSTTQTDLSNGLDTSDAFRAYQEQCNNYYLYQPYDTKDGILPRFMGHGRLNPVQFASGSFYFTVDIARSRQSQEFLGGSASLTASYRFKNPTPQIYNCWSVVENSSLVDISLQERSAFIIVK